MDDLSLSSISCIRTPALSSFVILVSTSQRCHGIIVANSENVNLIPNQESTSSRNRLHRSTRRPYQRSGRASRPRRDCKSVQIHPAGESTIINCRTIHESPRTARTAIPNTPSHHSLHSPRTETKHHRRPSNSLLGSCSRIQPRPRASSFLSSVDPLANTRYCSLVLLRRLTHRLAPRTNPFPR